MSDPGTSQIANMLDVGNDALTSAVNGSMKDYATQISELKKENFGLKLRIFYMEERMQEEFRGDHEQVFKTNIELKVECDSLRKELKDKHDLLVKASNAVACMEAVPNEVQKAREDTQRELQQVRDAMQDKVQEADRELRDVRAEADDLTMNVKKLQDYVKRLEDENQELKTYCEKANEEIAAIKESQPEAQFAPEASNASVMQQDILEKERLITQLQETLNVKQTVVEVLENEKKLEQKHLESYQELISSLKEKNENTQSEMEQVKQEAERMREEYMQHISDQQQKLDEFEIATHQMGEELEKREEEAQDLAKALKDAEETSRELADNLEKLQNEHECQKSNQLLMRDKAISGLTEVVRKKEEEVASLKSDVARQESTLVELTEKITDISSHNDSLEKKVLHLNELEEKLQQLQGYNMALKSKNEMLSSEAKSNEDRIHSMDEAMKDKDAKLQQLLSDYEKLKEQQQSDRQAAVTALNKQSEMELRFEQEKIEFSELMKKSETQLKESNKNAATEVEVKYLQEQLHMMETQLKAKQMELEEAMDLFKKAKSDSRSALDELEAAMKRRDEERRKEIESGLRIIDAKTAEIDRLHNEILKKEGRIQKLEDDLLLLDRKAREENENAIFHGRESCRLREESNQKDRAIAELTKSLEDLRNNMLCSGQEQFFDDEEYKKELDNARNTINSLTSELYTSQQQAIALHQSCKMKDKIIEESNKLIEDLEQRSRSNNDSAADEEARFVSTSTNTCMGIHADGSQASIFGSLAPSDNEHARHSSEEKEQLEAEIQELQKNLNELKDEYHDKTTLYESLRENAKQRKHLKRLSEILNEEQNIYRKRHPSQRVQEGDPQNTSDEAIILSNTKQVFDAQLQQVKQLRENLCSLLSNVTRDGNGPNQSHIDGDQERVDAQLMGLQDELTETRCKLANALKDVSDATRRSTDMAKLVSDLQQKCMENTELHRHLEESHHKAKMKDGEMTALRVEVEKLRFLSKHGSDSDVLSICSFDESEDLSSLSRRELMEVISNARKKLQNSEKLNELLRQQLDSSNVTDGAAVDQNLIQRLSAEVKHLRGQLEKTKTENGRSIQKSPTKVSPVARSKLPIPVNKGSEPRECSSPENVAIKQLRERCGYLRDKLSATEETVRHQKQKLEKCKSAMAAAGISNQVLSPIRSSTSHPNLLFRDQHDTAFGDALDLSYRQRHLSTGTAEAHTQTSSDDAGYSSLSAKSEERFNSLIQAQAKELSALRQKLGISRETCIDLKARLNSVLQYVSTLTSSDKLIPASNMLASSIASELDRCKELTRKLKRHLSEWSSESSTSDTESECSHVTDKGSIVHGPTSQLFKTNEELQRKNQKIFELEQRLHNLTQKLNMDTQTPHNMSKGFKFQPENIGILTPSSSQHSIDSDSEDELSTSVLFPTVSQNTEYVPLPDRQGQRRDQPSEVQFLKRRRDLPMYQRTIAVTEYLPDGTDEYAGSGISPARNGLSSASNSGTCTTTYGGSWSSPALRSDKNVGNGSSFSATSHIDRFPQRSVNVFPESSEVDFLRRQLDESKCLNRSLRQELDLTNELLKKVRESEAYDRTKGNPIDVLDMHLKGIQELRHHLESSIKINDSLRERLEQQAGPDERGEDFVTNVHFLEELRDLDSISRLEHQRQAEAYMKQNYADAAQELEQLRMKLVESSCQTDMLGKHIDVLNSEVDKERAQNEILHSQLKDGEEELDELRQKYEECMCKNNRLVLENQDARESVSRARDELNRVNEELDESHHLVRSLKSELALYEKVRKKGVLGECKSKNAEVVLDISELLAEIKQLRVQLERSIEVNNSLRQQLQERLCYNTSNPSSGKTTTINIHNLPSNTHDSRAIEKSTPSVPCSKKKRKKMNGDHQSTSVLITPPPSALSCSEENGPSFEFPVLSEQSTKQTFAHSDRSRNRPYYSPGGTHVIGNLDDYEALKRNMTDGRLLMKGIERNVEENLVTLSKMLEESCCLLKMFWPADISSPSFESKSLSKNSCLEKAATKRDDAFDISKCTKDDGSTSDSTVNFEADGLRREVRKLHKRLSAQDRLLQSTVSRLQTANRMKEGIEHAILKQLTVTHDVLKKARGNLEAQAADTRSTKGKASFR